MSQLSLPAPHIWLPLMHWYARELWVGRAPRLLFALVLGVSGLAVFAGSLGMVETRVQILVFYAGLIRPALMLLVTLLVVSAVVQEFDSAGLTLVLSRPVGRNSWYGARLLTFVLGTALAALVAGLPTLLLAPWQDSLRWMVSLAGELALVAGFAFAAAVGLGQIAAATTATVAFYVLGRVMATLELMTGTQSRLPDSPWELVLREVLHGLTWVLPDFSRYAGSSGLAYGMPPVDALLVLQTLVYLGLLGLLGLLDFGRRPL